MRRSELKRRTPLRKSKPDPVWFAARDAALERDGHWPTCHRLGLTGPCWGGVEVHHVLRRSRGGGHDLDNLLTLCAGHHRYVHEHPAESYERGWLKRGAA